MNVKTERKKPFKIQQSTYKNVLISLTQSYFKKPWHKFVEEIAILALVILTNLYDEACFYAKNQITFCHKIVAKKQAFYFRLFGESPCLKSDSHLPKKCFFCFNESPLKMMKNTFYFMLKALFFLEIFKFLS